ncbi:hypothetical protein [Maribacter sp. 2307UL18-2]
MKIRESPPTPKKRKMLLKSGLYTQGMKFTSKPATAHTNEASIAKV